MQEYNNTNSSPDSVRAAKITVVLSPEGRVVLSLCSSSGQVNTVSAGVCDYLYGRDVDSTGKFCAGGAVDACQVSGDWSLGSGDDCGITIIIGFD